LRSLAIDGRLILEYVKKLRLLIGLNWIRI